MQRKRINESALDIEYHYTNLRGLRSMMATDTFNLNDTEAEKRGGPHMSLTRMRSSRSGFGFGAARNAEQFGEVLVRIELDGQKLNNVRNVSVKPYDYNYNEFQGMDDDNDLGIDMKTMQLPQRSQIMRDAMAGELKAPYNTEEAEAEDSLTINGDDQITDASEYVTRVDIYCPQHISSNQIAMMEKFLRKDLEDYPDWGEKVHLFTDIGAFDYQRDEKEVSVGDIYRMYRQQAQPVTISEADLKNMIRGCLDGILNEAMSQPQQQAPGIRERFNRVRNLNKMLWNVKKEADALQLENVSKWIYMAIQSIDREFVGDTVSNAWNKAKETVGGWFNGGQQQ